MTESHLQFGTILTEPWEFFCINELRHPHIDQLEAPILKPVQMLSLVHWEESRLSPLCFKRSDCDDV